jgi:hypothetical protein
MNLTDHLLANRESISLQAARVYLGSRVRVRTPLGASEFLMVRCPAPRSYGPRNEDPVEMRRAYEGRVKIALDCDEIYRVAFPREYAGSPSPYLSLQREQEVYKLIHRLFPVLWVEDDGAPITVRGLGSIPRPATNSEVARWFEEHADFFLPYIPLRGAQRHVWNSGWTDFDEVNLAYQVAWALSREFDDPPDAGEGARAPGKRRDRYEAWRELNELRGLDLPEPLPPLASIGWTELLHTCAVEQTPLRFLPLAFQAISYKTGNRFLDLPQVGAMGFRWDIREVVKLHILWGNALDIMQAIDALAAWLEEDPKARVGRAYEIWNRAAAIEAESPFAGMLASDLIDAGGVPMGGENVLLTAALVAGVQRELQGTLGAVPLEVMLREGAAEQIA